MDRGYRGTLRIEALTDPGAENAGIDHLGLLTSVIADELQETEDEVDLR